MRMIFNIIRGKKINNKKEQILLGYSSIIFVSVKHSDISTHELLCWIHWLFLLSAGKERHQLTPAYEKHH